MIGMACLAMSLSSCISVDTKAFGERVSAERTLGLDGRFRNFPRYHSTSREFKTPWTLEQYLGDDRPGRDYETAWVKYRDGTGLTLTFWHDGKAEYSKRFTAADGVRRDPDGRIVIAAKGGCELGWDSPTLGGCSRGDTTVFVNDKGELVVVISHSAVGTLGLIPIVDHANWVAIFPPDDE